MSAKSGARRKVANEVVSSEFGSSGRYHALTMLPDGSLLASRGHAIYHIQSQGGVHRYAGTLEPGSIDGDRLKGSLFNRPTGIHSSEGAVFVVGSGEHKIRSIKDDMVSTFAGTGALGWRDGPKEESVFSFPEQMTEMNRVLFVTDTGNNRIRMIDKMTGFVSSIGSSRSISQDGDFLSCSFNAPKGICPAPDRSFLIVSDHFGHLLRRVDIGPVPTVTTVVGKQNLLPLTSQRASDPDIFEVSPSEESKEPIAHGIEPFKLHLKAPWGVTFTHDGDLVVCDLEGQSLLLLTPSGLAYDILSTASPTSCVVDPRSGSLVWLSRSAGLQTLPEFSSRSPERPPVDPRWLCLDGIDYSWILDSPGAHTISDAHFAHIPSSNLYHLHNCVLQCVGTDLDSLDKLSVCDFPIQVVEALIRSFYGKRPRLSQPHADDKFSPQFQLCATYARLSFLYALLELRDWCHWAERQFQAALILLSAPELIQLSVTLSNDSAGNNMHCLDMISQHWRVLTTGDIALKESAISMLFSNIDAKLLAIFMGPPISSDAQSPKLESPASKPISEESSYSPPQPLEGELQSPLATLSNTLLTFGSKLKFRKASKKDKSISRSSSKRNLKGSGSETSSMQLQHFEEDLEDRFRSFSLQLSLQCPHQLTPPNVVLTVLQHSKLLEVHDWVLCKWSYCRKLLVSKATPQSRKIMIESMPSSSRSLSSSTSAPSSGTNSPSPSLQISTPGTVSSQQELHEVQTLEFPAGFPKPLLLFIVQSLYGVPLLMDDLSNQECSFFVENAAKYEFCMLPHEKSHPTEQTASPGFQDLMTYCKERLEGGGFPSRWARKKWMFWR